MLGRVRSMPRSSSSTAGRASRRPPNQARLPVRRGREVRQSRIAMPEGAALCVVRAVVDSVFNWTHGYRIYTNPFIQDRRSG